MKIAILGSTGFVGKRLLKRALAEGYEVKVLVRDPEKLGDLKDKVEVIQGNYFEADKVDQTICGTEAVLSTIGPLAKNTGTPEQFEQAMVSLVSAMKKNRLTRIIWTGGAPTTFGNEKLGFKRSLLKFVIDLYWGKHVLQTKNKEYSVLARSGLDWTLVRPPQITEGAPTGKVIADEKNLAGTKIDVEDVAAFILDQIKSDKWMGKAPLLASG